jgi:penicillin amidase
MEQALDRLTELLGSDMSGWAWGRLHRVRTKHLLTGRGDLAQLLDREGGPVAGGGGTVLSAGWDAEFKTVGGSNYRLTADMADSPPGLWAHDVSGASGHPGSPNYCDQLDDWAAGIQHYLPMDRERAEAAAVSRLRLAPK